MIESEERHYRKCTLDPEECERCFWITEAKGGGIILNTKPIEQETKNNNPLYDLIMEKFKGETIK